MCNLPPAAHSRTTPTHQTPHESTNPPCTRYLNGIHSLITYGLTSCNKGFGTNKVSRGQCWVEGALADGTLSGSLTTHDGALAWTPQGDASNAAVVVSELSLLLTAGRLSTHTKTIIEAAFEAERTQSSAAEALKVATKLMTASAEFSTTNQAQTGAARPTSQTTTSQNRPYKAIVTIFLNGGIDSFNVLVPHSNSDESTCTVAGQYSTIRAVPAGFALTDSELETLEVPVGTPPQPCDIMAVNKKLSVVKKLYDDGDAAFIANVGPLVEPCTKAEFLAKAKLVPQGLFAHNVQQFVTQNVHAGVAFTKGILGRIIDAVGAAQGSAFKTAAYSLQGSAQCLVGDTAVEFLSPGAGAVRYAEFNDLGDEIGDMSTPQLSSIFGDTFAELLDASIKSGEALGTVLDEFPIEGTTNKPYDEQTLSKQLRQVARVIKSGYQSAERDVFFTQMGAFDTHSDAKDVLSEKLTQMNSALDWFIDEMIQQGNWDNVLIITSSDSARTLASNGLGTDHAWGGHHMILGGGVKGKQILGRYPDDLSDDGDYSIRQGGRFIPTTSWEAVWHGVAQWFGVGAERMGDVLPNMGNFPLADMLTKDDMFD